jgi:hypothetical protein
MMAGRTQGFIALFFSLAIASPVVAQAPARDSAWTIRAGSYVGTTVKLDRDAASRRGSRFLRVSKLKHDERFVGWNPSRLPAAVAFGTGRHVSEADSIAFWTILRQMETDIGMRLFEPTTLATDPDPYDVIIVDTKNMAGDDGVTFVTWSNNGALYDARVFFRSPGILHSSRVVTHEMMHALGFGHTSAWTSVMGPNASGPDRLTPLDVAYAQFGFESRAASERSDMWERLALAVDRDPQPRDLLDGYAPCPTVSSNSFGERTMMRPGALAVVGALTAITACSGGNNKGADTIAVPAAAVDTTTNRTGAVPPDSTSIPATGVDTPITRKLGSPAPAKR